MFPTYYKGGQEAALPLKVSLTETRVEEYLQKSFFVIAIHPHKKKKVCFLSVLY